jgi:hypothetical protein
MVKRLISLVSTGRIYPFILGRFYLIRKLTSLIKKITSPKKRPDLQSSTCFPSVSVSRAVSDLRENAVAFGLDLSESDSQEIREFAETNPCTREGLKRDFFYNDVKNGRLQDGSLVALGRLRKPHLCAPISRISRDPALWEIAKQYLGYTPKRADIRLFWSFASDLTDSDRRKLAQTIDFHIDVYSFNFCYAHWYISDVTKDSGAHELIRGSHIKKRLRWLFGSTMQSSDVLAEYYKPDDFLVIEVDPDVRPSPGVS